jgi:hypothetical protein
MGSWDNAATEIIIRGRKFPLPLDPFSGDAAARVMVTCILGLYALEDPKVDEVLRVGRFSFMWPDGRREWLFQDQRNERTGK